jgi:hypothetical protein
MSFGFINSIIFCFVISYICLSVFQVCQCSLFQVMSSILFIPYDIEDNVSFWLGGEGSG